MNPVERIAVGATIIVAILLFRWFMQEQCPKCDARGTLRWANQRVGGGPDRRFKNNHQQCTACGWTNRPS